MALARFGALLCSRLLRLPSQSLNLRLYSFPRLGLLFGARLLVVSHCPPLFGDVNAIRALASSRT
jgi:hypothetical protein